MQIHWEKVWGGSTALIIMASQFFILFWLIHNFGQIGAGKVVVLNTLFVFFRLLDFSGPASFLSVLNQEKFSKSQIFSYFLLRVFLSNLLIAIVFYYAAELILSFITGEYQLTSMMLGVCALIILFQGVSIFLNFALEAVNKTFVKLVITIATQILIIFGLILASPTTIFQYFLLYCFALFSGLCLNLYFNFKHFSFKDGASLGNLLEFQRLTFKKGGMVGLLSILSSLPETVFRLAVAKIDLGSVAMIDVLLRVPIFVRQIFGSAYQSSMWRYVERERSFQNKYLIKLLIPVFILLLTSTFLIINVLFSEFRNISYGLILIVCLGYSFHIISVPIYFSNIARGMVIKNIFASFLLILVLAIGLVISFNIEDGISSALLTLSLSSIVLTIFLFISAKR